MPAALATDRLILRPYSMGDFAAARRFDSSYENLMMTEWGPNTEEETKSFLRFAVEAGTKEPCRDFQFAIVLKATGEMIGGCGIEMDVEGRQAEIGWVLHRDYQKQGIGTEAAHELLRFGFERLKLHRIYAVCRSDNYGSYRVMERNGMRREGLLLKKRPGRHCDLEPWYDELQYAILAEEWNK